MKDKFKYIIAIGVVTLIIVTLFELVIMPLYVRQGKSRELVDVSAMDVDAALTMIKSSGFKGVIADTIFTAEYEPNTVIDQYPKPGSIVKKGRTVRLNISHAEKLVDVPNIVGKSHRSAELLLRKAGLKIGAISKSYSIIYPVGVIIGQIPDSAETIPKGYRVRVVMSKGRSPNNIQVPSLFGLSKESATDELQKVGLALGKVHYKQNVDLIPYTVIEQSVEAGTVLAESQPVNLTVSVLDLQDIFEQVIDK